MENYIDLLKLVLPEMIVDHFDLVKSSKEEEKLQLFFEEKNTLPKEIKDRELISKGFPLRGRLVFLHVRRRRWTDKETGEIIQRDWNIVSKGTRMTTEFALFLKEINQY